MKNIKKLSIILIALLAIIGLSACTTKDTTKPQENKSNKPVMNVALLKGPSGMSMAVLMDLDEKGETKVDYNFQILNSPDEVVGKIASGEIDVATVPSNLGPVLNNKTQGKIKMLAVNSLGTLYILEKGNSINNFKDLAGKKIVSSGQGSTPEYVIEHMLKKAGIADQATVEYLGGHAEVAAKFLTGEADVIMIPEPFVSQITTKEPKAKIALNLTKEWENLTSSPLPMTSVIARTDYIDKNKEAINNFLSEAGPAVDTLQGDHVAAAKLIEKFGIMPAPIAEKALPNSNITFIIGSQIIEPMQKYFQILFDSNPKSVGGTMPTENFYYVG